MLSLRLLRGLPTSREVFTGLIIAAIVAGVLQAPLVSISHNSLFKWADDFTVLIFLTLGWIVSVTSARRNEKFAAWTLAALGVYVAVWVALSPIWDLGVAQARQVVLPLGIALIGYARVGDIDWRVLFYWVLGIVLLTTAWVYAEGILQAPLIDANWNFLAAGASESGLRQGIPSAYYADGVFGQTVFRSGGPFMNPPSAGFVLGLGGLAARMSIRSVPVRWICYLALVGALGLTFARAGMLIFVCATLLPWAWAKFGRKSTLIVGVVAAIGVALTFLPQGATASHAVGLIKGLQDGLTHPFGQGFGLHGYQVALASGKITNVSESLLGLYAAWLGWPVLALAGWAIWQIVRRAWTESSSGAAAQWCTIGMLSAAAFSETASAISCTVVLWLIVGASLRRELNGDPTWTQGGKPIRCPAAASQPK